MKVLVNAGSLTTRMELLPSSLKGAFPFFAIGKNAVFNCFQDQALGIHSKRRK